MNRIQVLFFVLATLVVGLPAQNVRSVFTSRPQDDTAVYFHSNRNDDVSDALQQALNEAKGKENGCGILFIPEGKYYLSKTIYIPSGVRMIGYGSKRPLFILAKNTPGFQKGTQETSKGKYLFWFISGDYQQGKRVSDANAGTFYSSINNINIRIEDGNPNASAIRAHFAQHCSISNVSIEMGNGRAGIVDAGNHLENISVYGGDYGIDTDKSSPGWPIMLLNSYFEGQRKSAILTHEGGLTIVRMRTCNVPVAVEVVKDAPERLFMEDCIFEDIDKTGLLFTTTGNAANQINLINIQCKNVPVFAQNHIGEQKIHAEGKTYNVKRFLCGLNMDSLSGEPQTVNRIQLEKTKRIEPFQTAGMPQLPPVEQWINIRDLGAKGDGKSDDTNVFQEAINTYTNIYIPQGWYVIKQPLILKENTNLIGLHPGTTVFLAFGGNPAFSGFGSPQAQITAPQNGTNIVCGIFLNADAYNYRAVNCKWMAGENSYMFDVKFSGHDKARFRFNGQSAANPLEKPIPVGPETNELMKRAWDNQHWSLWITDGGGGTFRDIWTANEYSSAGLYVSHTDTPGRIYGMSLEHHLRNEAIFRNVRNWKIYDFQFEEEAEGTDTQPLELVNCENLTFANLYAYRVSRMRKPYPSAIRTWNCRNLEFLNIHNYAHARIKFTADASLYDVNTRWEARQWEMARLYLTGKESKTYTTNAGKGKIEMLANGFEFIDGLTKDSKGNIYFCEQRMRRIYKIDAKNGFITSIADLPWETIALACDTKDNLIVITKYIAQPGYDNEDKREPNKPLFGWRGKGGLWGFNYVPKVYAIRPENPETTFEVLQLKDMKTLPSPEKVIYPVNRKINYMEYYNGKKPEQCFVAPDKKTYIPYYEDLFRCSSLTAAYPGEFIYLTDEYNLRIIRAKLDKQGFIHKPKVFINEGDRCVTVDRKGNIYVGNGNIRVYTPDGKLLDTIITPERPNSLLTTEHKVFITTRTSIYQIRLK